MHKITKTHRKLSHMPATNMLKETRVTRTSDVTLTWFRRVS